MRFQGTQNQPSHKDVSTETEQLKRSAEMFEMILETSPEAVENYIALKDIYRRLDRKEDFRRVVKGLAEIYLGSGQREKAAREYAEILRLDPDDSEALDGLGGIGYSRADLPVLQAERKVIDIRRRYEQKSRELAAAEEAFLKASARTRRVRGGDDEETCSLLRSIEEQIDGEIRKAVTQHEQWLKDGHAQVFKEIAEDIKREADRIIRTDELDNIRKSVKKAEKLVASTDRVFQQEWQRTSREREEEYQHTIQELNRKKEERLRSCLEEAIAQAEQEQSAADLALRGIKDEVRQLEGQLKEEEKQPQRAKEPGSSRPHSTVAVERKQPPPAVVVCAPSGVSDEEAKGGAPASPPKTFPKDEVGKTLGSILVQHGLVTREELEEALAKQREDRRPIGQILVESGHATEEDIINALVAQAGVPYLPLANYEISDEVAMIIPREVALRFNLVPVDTIGSGLLVAMGIPLSREQKEEVQRHVGEMKIRYFISSWSDIKAKHEQHYG